jgi:hypothetical protein
MHETLAQSLAWNKMKSKRTAVWTKPNKAMEAAPLGIQLPPLCFWKTGYGVKEYSQNSKFSVFLLSFRFSWDLLSFSLLLLPFGIEMSVQCLSHNCTLEAHNLFICILEAFNLFDFTGSQLEKDLPQDKLMNHTLSLICILIRQLDEILHFHFKVDVGTN